MHINFYGFAIIWQFDSINEALPYVRNEGMSLV